MSIGPAVDTHDEFINQCLIKAWKFIDRVESDVSRV